jgi:MFS family permease
VRYLVLSILCAGALVSYISRNAISVPEEDIRYALELSEMQMGLVMSAFFLAYAVFQIPGARLAEGWGSRRALTLFAVIWSASSAVLGLAAGFWSLFVTRLVMGAAQAGLLPGAVLSIKAWLPATRTAFACGWIASAMSIGSAVTAPIAGVMLDADIGWRWVFGLFALPGLAWAVWFFGWFRDRPEEHPSITAAELEAIRGVRPEPPVTDSAGPRASVTGRPWAAMAATLTLWLICGQQFFRAAAYLFFTTWFPTFLKKTQNVSTAESGWLTSLPFLAVVIGSPLGGILVDRIWARTGSRRLSRQVVAAACLWLSAALVFLAYWASGTAVVVTLITLSSFSFALAGPSSYAITIDMGGRHVGAVFATMNMAGSVAAVFAPLGPPLILKTTGIWDHALLLLGGMYVLAALCWTLLNPAGTIGESAALDKAETEAAR